MTNRNGAKWIWPATRLAIYLRDNLQCVYCLASLEDEGTTLTLDHVKPREKGGTNAARNLVTACLTCNSRRQSRAVGEFMTGLRLPVGVAARVRNAVRRRLPREPARTLIELRKSSRVTETGGERGDIVTVAVRIGDFTHENPGSASGTLQLTAAREAALAGEPFDPTGLGYLPKDTPKRPLRGHGDVYNAGDGTWRYNED